MPHPVQSEQSWFRVPDSDPPQYSRPLQGVELTHYCSDRLNNGLSEVVMGVLFKTTLSIETLCLRAHNAMGHMRFVIPIVACSIHAETHDPFSSSFVYKAVRDHADLHDWISATLTVRFGPFDPETFVAEMNARTVPYVHPDGHEQPSHFYLLVDDTSKPSCETGSVHGLFMHGPHTLMDAFPTLRCLDALLGWIAAPPIYTLEQLPWGEEWSSLPAPPIEATGGIRDDWDTDGVKLMNEMNEILAHPTPSHSLIPSRSNISVDGQMTRVHAHFDSETTARIVRATKALGFTPSALFDASVCLATFARNPVRPENSETAHFTFDPTVIAQDRYLIPPHNGLSHFIAGLCLICLRVPYNTIPSSAPRREQLITIMAQLKAQMDHFLKNPNLPHVIPAQLACRTPRLAQDISNPFVSITSNMGNLNSWLKDKVTSDGNEKVVQVVDMVFGHRLPWKRIMFHCWSLNGEMRLQVQASDVWDETEMRRYLSDVRGMMLEILCMPPTEETELYPTTNDTCQRAPVQHGKTLPFPGDKFTSRIYHEPYNGITVRPTDLAGRVVFISGASSCLGRAAALSCAQAGATGLVLTARSHNMDTLDALESQITNLFCGVKILTVAMDIRDTASIASAVSVTLDTFRSIDTLLNIGGYVDATVQLTESDLSDWWTATETNVRGTWAVTRSLLPLLQDSPSEVKWIVNYSSFTAHNTSSLCSGYGISKLTLLHLTEILSVELSSSPTLSNIHVVALFPGLVQSPMTLNSMRPEHHQYLIDSPKLSAESAVWIVKERRDWLSGRFISCTWDLMELAEKKEEILAKDLLRMRLRIE